MGCPLRLRDKILKTSDPSILQIPQISLKTAFEFVRDDVHANRRDIDFAKGKHVRRILDDCSQSLHLCNGMIESLLDLVQKNQPVQYCGIGQSNLGQLQLKSPSGTHEVGSLTLQATIPSIVQYH